jgi:hypothetical protein
MAAADDFGEVLKQYHLALDEIIEVHPYTLAASLSR